MSITDTMCAYPGCLNKGTIPVTIDGVGKGAYCIHHVQPLMKVSLSIGGVPAVSITYVPRED